jgi:single-stranded-DNA-specific exonuclease
LAQALLRSHRQTPVTDASVRLREEDLLDLVALGTVADLAPLMGENRALVRRGLARLNQMERPGVEALCRMKNLTAGGITASTISYVLGPRLNAAGRMAKADTAYRILDTQYPAEAKRSAQDLEHLNRERQELTRENQQRARELAQARGAGAHLLFAAAPDFWPGIVGLVASRLVDEFYRPAVVVEIGETFSRGSARSIPEFHITQALDECADLFERHGGHAAAGGFKIATEKLPALEQRLRRLADTALGEMDLEPAILVDQEIPLSEMTWDLQRALEQLEPCGYGNPHPLFCSRGVEVRHQRAVGKERRHLKLTLSDGGSTLWDAIAFRQGEWAHKLTDHIDIVYQLEINEWQGTRNLQLNVKDLRPTGISEIIARQWLQEESTEA